MAKSSGSGAVYFIVATLGFAALIATVLAVVFGSKVPAANDAQKKAEADLQRFVSSAEQVNPEITAYDRPDSGKSIVGNMLDEISALKTRVVGRPNDSLETIIQDIQNAGIQSNLMQEVSDLNTEIQSNETTIKTLEEDVRSADARADAAAANAQALKTEFAQAQQKQQADYEKLKENYTTAENEHANSIRALENRLASLTQQSTDTINQQKGRILSLEGEVSELKRLLEDCRGTGTQIAEDAVDPRRLPDGAILSVIPEHGLVYIDRGRTDSLVLGVTFEVYSRKTGVVENADGEWTGKATLEVINVKEDFSIARIVRKDPLSEVFEGDVISNVVWDPYYPFTFFVFGKFDIDRTGQESIGDRRRVISMIEQWNGKVVKDANEDPDRTLSYDVDFVLLGIPPEEPEPLAEGVIHRPEVLIEHERKQKEFEQYQDVIAEAKALTIPILNQNRFLELIGYHRR